MTIVGKDNNIRFDQKYNMYYQGEWNPACSHLSRESKYLSLRNKLREGGLGYTPLDDALQKGAGSVLRYLNIEINRANRGGTAWRTHVRDNCLVLSPQEAAQAVQAAAALFGADDFGTCRLLRSRIYSHYYDPEARQSFPIHFSDEAPSNADSDQSLVIPADMDSVLVLIVEMDFDAVGTAPALPQVAATAASYSKLAALVTSLSEFICSLGYKAIPSINCTGLNIPLAIDAGLGKLGRNGLLIHPRFGPRCRIAKIITNLPLPEGRPGQDYLKDYCNECGKCAVNCPAQAISYGEPSARPRGNHSLEGMIKWQVDYRKCREYWIESGTNCGICVNACTFNVKTD